MKKTIAVILIVVAALTLTACFARTTGVDAEPPGFARGWWHGAILPLSFIVSLFDHTVRVYAVPNNGGWYNFGFVLGILSLLGGGGGSGAASRRSWRRRHDR